VQATELLSAEDFILHELPFLILFSSSSIVAMTYDSATGSSGPAD
jgi:hypothetical protein